MRDVEIPRLEYHNISTKTRFSNLQTYNNSTRWQNFDFCRVTDNGNSTRRHKFTFCRITEVGNSTKLHILLRCQIIVNRWLDKTFFFFLRCQIIISWNSTNIKYLSNVKITEVGKLDKSHFFVIFCYCKSVTWPKQKLYLSKYHGVHLACPLIASVFFFSSA